MNGCGYYDSIELDATLRKNRIVSTVISKAKPIFALSLPQTIMSIELSTSAL